MDSMENVQDVHGIHGLSIQTGYHFNFQFAHSKSDIMGRYDSLKTVQQQLTDLRPREPARQSIIRL